MVNAAICGDREKRIEVNQCVVRGLLDHVAVVLYVVWLIKPRKLGGRLKWLGVAGGCMPDEVSK